MANLIHYNELKGGFSTITHNSTSNHPIEFDDVLDSFNPTFIKKTDILSPRPISTKYMPSVAIHDLYGLALDLAEKSGFDYVRLGNVVTSPVKPSKSRFKRLFQDLTKFHIGAVAEFYNKSD